MAGPWDDYKTGGPWEDFQPAPEANQPEVDRFKAGPSVMPTPAAPSIMDDQTLAGRDARYNAVNGLISNSASQALQPLVGDPTQFAKPPQSNTGNPVMDSLLKLLQPLQGITGPSRLSAAISAPGQAAGKAVEQQIGPDHPVLGKLANLGTSMALDPQSYAMPDMAAGAVAAGDAAAKAVGNGILAPMASVASGVPEREIKTLASKPLEVIFAHTQKAVGDAFGAAKKAAGVTNLDERLIAAAGDRAAGTARKIADEMAAKVSKGEDLTIGEILAGKRGASKIAQSGKGSESAIYAKDADMFDKMLQERAPQLADLQNAYSLTKTRQAFMNLVGQNKTGGNSQVRGILQMLAAAAATAAPKTAATLSAAMSPVTAGLGTAAVAGGYKAAKAAVGNPVVSTGLLGAFRDYLEKQRLNQ